MTDTKSKDTRTLIQKKIDAYWILGNKLHISLKSGHWKRGIIKDVKTDFFILNESLEGEVPVFFEEVEKVEIYTPKKEDWK